MKDFNSKVDPVVAWIIFWVIACMAVMVCCGSTYAQRDTDTRRADTLWVARICVHEATWHGIEGSDCGALFQLLSNRRRSGEVGIERALAAYSHRFYGETSSRAWAARLTVDQETTPRGWPATWPEFPVFAERWRLVVERTARAVYGVDRMPCSGVPWHWGSRNPHLPDRQRAERAIREGRWREVNCGDTVNAHYELVRWTTEEAL